jgi:ribosomal-protein-alanine N-acetyltransferase
VTARPRRRRKENPDVRAQRLERDGADADIDAIVVLEAESFTNPWSRDTLVWELRNSDVTRVYVLRDDADRVVAFCLCWVIFDELHINTLAVSPAARQQGLGSMLMRFAMEDAAAAGATRATLEVRASNEAALALYRRLGFVIAARRPGYYSKPDEDGLILWKEGLGASP